MRIDGVVLLDKPEGLSSNAALQRVKRAFGADKAGHTGTLDPFATGLLPLCLGDATKFSQGLLDADKAYLATALLGVATDTADRDGRVIAQQPVCADAAAIDEALAALTGALEQVPPMYSAIKQGGRPLYAIARAGGEVERSARTVTIHALTRVDWNPPYLTFAVRASKGTYVRTLAEQIAQRLGTVAHLTALRRTAVGPFEVAQAVPLDVLLAAPPESRCSWLLPADTLSLGLPGLVLSASAVAALLQGRELTLAEDLSSEVGQIVRVYGPGRAVHDRAIGAGAAAVVERDATGGWRPGGAADAAVRAAPDAAADAAVDAAAGTGPGGGRTAGLPAHAGTPDAARAGAAVAERPDSGAAITAATPAPVSRPPVVEAGVPAGSGALRLLPGQRPEGTTLRFVGAATWSTRGRLQPLRLIAHSAAAPGPAAAESA